MMTYKKTLKALEEIRMQIVEAIRASENCSDVPVEQLRASLTQLDRVIETYVERARDLYLKLDGDYFI